MTRLLPVLSMLLILAGCAPSPLYFSTRNVRPGTGGEIPRDTRGEPIWTAIRPTPNWDLYVPAPPRPK